jgi:hypothetical protein
MQNRKTRFIRLWKLTLLIILFPYIIFAQTNDKQKHNFINRLSLQMSYQSGYVFPTNDFIKGINLGIDEIDEFQAFSLKISTQSNGSKIWEQLYKYPNYGVGLYLADFQRPSEIGTPLGIYGFFIAPFKRRDLITLNYEIGFGVTFNWKRYDPVSNKYNIAIGAGQSFLIDAGMNIQYSLTNKLILEGGFTLTHFSNGALKMPNKGINTIAPKISIKYNFYNSPIFIENDIPDFNSNNEWLFTFFGGAKNIVFDSVNIDIYEKYEGINYPIFGTSLTFNRQLSYKSKLGIGMSLSYNGSIDAQVAVDNNEMEPISGIFSEKLQLSLFPSYELVVNKVSLILQPSFYIYRKKTKNQTPVFYQKIGLKYHVTDDFFCGITLRDYKFHVSDFIEWNVGYRIKSK